MPTSKKILVVDDEFPIRYMVEHALQRKGYDVFSAKDGPSAIAAAESYQPDLIVLDVMMPEMDGFDVCEQLKAKPTTAEIPVVFLTALMTRKHKWRAFEVGADDYLVKPFQADELLAHVSSVLRKTGRLEKRQTVGVRNQVVAFFSPKGGVGATTLAIQLSEALAINQDYDIVLLDLDLPLGGLAAELNLFTRNHIVNLLRHPANQISTQLLHRYLQQHRRNLLVVPAPGKMIPDAQMPSPNHVEPMLTKLQEMDYKIILDLGSSLTPIAIAAMQEVDLLYTVTSGQPAANRLVNAFIETASDLGIESSRILPVINEVHGSVSDVELARVPIVRIPHANDVSRSKLWLREQGLQKLLSVMA